MFDFDGTLALVRAGWMPLMLDMMMETLGPLGDDPGKLRDEAEEYVARYTGKDTVHQTAAFASHVASLGGSPQSAEFYKAEFLRRMEHLRSERLNTPSDRLLVPGARALLEALRAAGMRIFLASGSEHADICREAKLLRIDHYFEGIYGSAPHSLTKRQLLAHIIATGIPASASSLSGMGARKSRTPKRWAGRQSALPPMSGNALRSMPRSAAGWPVRARITLSRTTSTKGYCNWSLWDRRFRLSTLPSARNDIIP